MENYTIDVNMIDEGGQNPFDEIMRLVEREKLKGTEDEVVLGLEKKLLSVERVLYDLPEDDENYAVIINSTKKLMSEYLKVVTLKSSLGAFDTISRGLDTIKTTMEDVDYETPSSIANKIHALSIKKFLEKREKSTTTADEMLKIANINVVKVGIHNSKTTNIIAKELTKRTIDSEWKVNLNFDTPRYESHKPMEFLYQFIEIINQIDGVTVILEDIKIGSLKSKMKFIFESAKSKEEVKELLESSKKFAKNKLEKGYEETENIKAATKKLEIEKKLLEQQLEEKGSIDNAYLKAIEIQQAEEDLATKKLNNKYSV